MNPEFASRYGDLETWHWWFRGRERIVAAALRRGLGKRESAVAASLGCGPAQGLGWIARLVGPRGRVFGVDVQPVDSSAATPAGIHYVVGRAEASPFASRSFDVVLALDVLEHVVDDAGALREAARLLRPGGCLVATVPAFPSLWGQQDVVNRHHRRYTRRSLLAAFARAGLPRPRTSYFNALLFPAIAATRWSRRALGANDPQRSDFEANRPGLLNDALAALFSLERHAVFRVPVPFGVSLIARLCLPPD